MYVRWWSSGVGRRIFKPAKIRRRLISTLVKYAREKRSSNYITLVKRIEVNAS